MALDDDDDGDDDEDPETNESWGNFALFPISWKDEPSLELPGVEEAAVKNVGDDGDDEGGGEDEATWSRWAWIVASAASIAALTLA